MPHTKEELENIPKNITEALSVLETELGGREHVREIVSHLPEDNKYRALADALADPDSDKISLARVCQSLSIKPEHFLLVYRDARAAKALAESMDAVYDGLPRVAGTAVKYGQEHHQLCTSCYGTGQIEVPSKKKDEEPELKECKRCRGRGRILYVPDNDRVKTALEIGGLLKKGPSTQINLDQSKKQLNVFDAAKLKDFLAASDKALRVVGRREEEVSDLRDEGAE